MKLSRTLYLLVAIGFLFSLARGATPDSPDYRKYAPDR